MLRLIRERIHNLSRSVSLVESMMAEATKAMATRVSRMLISHERNDPGRTHTVVVTGTQKEIEATAQRMSRRTQSCVTVAVIVGRYHRRGCDDLSRGGYIEDGD